MDKNLNGKRAKKEGSKGTVSDSILDYLENLNSNIVTERVLYGPKYSEDEDDTSNVFYLVIVGNEDLPDVPKSKQCYKGDLIKFNARFLVQETYLEGRIYGIVDYNSAWFKIKKEYVKEDLLQRRS